VDPAALAAALARRAGLAADPTLDCYRLLHGWTEGLPGVEVDRYGDVVVIEARTDAEPAIAPLVAALEAALAPPAIVVRRRGPGVAAVATVRGDPPARVWVREHGLRFAIEPRRAGNPGLYLDARPTRAWIRAHAEGRRVLNLFAFTGSLGVAAMAGGARGVTHVDSSAAILAWCRDNHAANDLPIDDRALARMNVYQHLRRGAAGRQRFDAIILDPPPGPEQPRVGDRTPGERGPFALVPRLAGMLAPGGWLLVLVHHGLRAGQVEADVLAAAGVPLEVRWRGGAGPDFPEPDAARALQVVAFGRPA
jgi:23S rRNA (cytosine1962-C5)-methyltransferase